MTEIDEAAGETPMCAQCPAWLKRDDFAPCPFWLKGQPCPVEVGMSEVI